MTDKLLDEIIVLLHHEYLYKAALWGKDESANGDDFYNHYCEFADGIIPQLKSDLRNLMEKG